MSCHNLCKAKDFKGKFAVKGEKLIEKKKPADQKEAQQLILKLEIELNLKEYEIMQEYDKQERRRQQELSEVFDPLERKRLRNIQAVYRAREQERLSLIMKQHALQLEKLRSAWKFN